MVESMILWPYVIQEEEKTQGRVVATRVETEAREREMQIVLTLARRIPRFAAQNLGLKNSSSRMHVLMTWQS